MPGIVVDGLEGTADPDVLHGPHRFEAKWNRWNLLRTLTSIGSLACLAAAVAWAGRVAWRVS